MKKMLYLLLISSPIFSMQPTTPKCNGLNMTQASFKTAHLLNQSMCSTILPSPVTLPLNVIMAIGIHVAINRYMQKQ